MKREDVYHAIDSEREYQKQETHKETRPDMLEDFRMGDGIAALTALLATANAIWYIDSPPYQKTMEYLRKIAGTCVKLGEKYGMPER